MRIAICTRDLDYGVGSIVKQRLLELEMDATVDYVYVVAPKKIHGLGAKFRFITINLPGKYFITKEPYFAYVVRRILSKLVSKKQIDLIELHFPIMARNFGIPLVAVFHSFHLHMLSAPTFSFKERVGKLFHLAYFFIDYSTIFFADRSYFVSRSALNRVKKIFPRFQKKIFFKPNSVDSKVFYPASKGERASFRNRLGFSNSKINLLFVGRLDPAKGILDLVQAIKEVGENRFCLCVLGDGPLMPKIRCLNFVEALGHVDRNELRSYYCAADVFVLPSLYENAPVSIIEAKSCGCRILATPAGDNSYILSKQEIYFNHSELVERLKSL